GRVRWNASSPRSPPRMHLRSPAPEGIRADIPSRPDRLRDARRSSRLLRTSSLSSTADRSPPHALALPRSSPPWRHLPMRKPPLRCPPTTAPPLPGSQAESPPRVSSNHSWHQSPEHAILILESILPPPCLQRFLTPHRSRVNSPD